MCVFCHRKVCLEKYQEAVFFFLIPVRLGHLCSQEGAYLLTFCSLFHTPLSVQLCRMQDIWRAKESGGKNIYFCWLSRWCGKGWGKWEGSLRVVCAGLSSTQFGDLCFQALHLFHPEEGLCCSLSLLAHATTGCVRPYRHSVDFLAAVFFPSPA